MEPDLARERALSEGTLTVCGMDEVGRGALAGPVTIGAVVPDLLAEPPEGVRDSKLLSPRRRTLLVPLIQAWALAWGVGSASAAEIDALGLTQALGLAARRALSVVEATLEVGAVILDGPHDYLRDARVTPVVKADLSCLSVAAASILAKVSRDHELAELARDHPHYGFERNAGYGSPQHLAGLREHGVSPQHRRSWSTIKALSTTQDPLF